MSDNQHEVPQAAPREPPSEGDGATLPTSTVEHNIELNKQIVDREGPPDWNTPWRARKFAVTVMTTFRNLFVLRGNKK